MIKRMTIVALFASACSLGGAGGETGFEPESGEAIGASLASLECVSDAEERALSHLYGRVDDSLHEMVACGGAQVSVASSFLAGLVASNEGLFRNQEDYDALAQAVSTVGIQLRVPFRHQSNGTWSVNMDATNPDSVFQFDVFEPGAPEGADVTSERRIMVDPFVIESYLSGVRIDSSLDMDEMLSSPTSATTLTFHWEQEGPLAYLLNEGRPLPNPFEIEFSLIDLVFLSWGSVSVDALSFGPLASLLEIQMESSGVFDDERADVMVSYLFSSPRATLNETSQARSVDFDLGQLTATNGTYSLRGVSDTVEYTDSANGLRGQVVFMVEGTEQPVRVTADYGAGSAYSAARWECL